MVVLGRPPISNHSKGCWVFVADVAPVRVSGFDAAGYIFQPLRLNAVVQIQVELAVNDAPYLRIANKFLANRCAKCAIAAVCRYVFFRVLLKCLLIVGTRELVRCTVVNGDKLAVAADRSFAGLVRDEVLALHCLCAMGEICR